MNSKNINICILDYGSGNVMSVLNAFLSLGYNATISNQNNIIINSSHIVLPGVGSYGSSMEKLKKKLDISIIQKQVHEIKKPFLGICVGMQLLSDFGNEFKNTKGLGWIQGHVDKINTKKKLPHIGWNKIKILKNSKLLDKINDKMYFYFVHSYRYNCKNEKNIIANTEYDSFFPSIINLKNIFGVQFHPEKSQKAGLLLLKNFIENTL